MTAKLELTFYLPYRLPRESKSWGTDILFTEINGLQSGIMALPRGAADQPPKNPDGLTIQTLSSDGTPIHDDMSQSQPMLNQYTRFYDAVVAVIIGELDGDSPNTKEREKFLNAGIAAASRFIHFCKVLSRDDLIFFNTPPVGSNLHIEGFPYSENWFDADSNQLLGPPTLNSSYSQSVGVRHGMNPIPWNLLKAAYQSSEPPRIDILLLLESRSAFMNADDRKAVLFAAMAAEISAFVLIEQKLADKSLRKQLYTMDLEVWEKLFDALPKVMGLPSLKKENSTLFTQLSRLFRARNKIAHEGLCYIDRNDLQQPILLTRSQIWDLISVAEKVIDWVISL